MAGETYTADAVVKTSGSTGGGFPPFDASMFSHQIFWFWITFGALYIVLATVVIPRIAKTLAARQGSIDSDLKAAAAETAAAQAARLKSDKASSDARAHARKTIDEMRAVNAEAALKADAEANVLVSARIAAEEARIAASRKAAMSRIAETTNDLASAIVEQVIGAKPDAKVVSTAMASLAFEGAT